MLKITESFDDYNYTSRKSNIVLKAENHEGTNKDPYPIIWRGQINDIKIEIAQSGPSVINERDLIFREFPDNYDFLKGDIIQWISKSLRKFD